MIVIREFALLWARCFLWGFAPARIRHGAFFALKERAETMKFRLPEGRGASCRSNLANPSEDRRLYRSAAAATARKAAAQRAALLFRILGNHRGTAALRRRRPDGFRPRKHQDSRNCRGGDDGPDAAPLATPVRDNGRGGRAVLRNVPERPDMQGCIKDKIWRGVFAS